MGPLEVVGLGQCNQALLAHLTFSFFVAGFARNFEGCVESLKSFNDLIPTDLGNVEVFLATILTQLWRFNEDFLMALEDLLYHLLLALMNQLLNPLVSMELTRLLYFLAIIVSVRGHQPFIISQYQLKVFG
jgi:hypothetical protein